MSNILYITFVTYAMGVAGFLGGISLIAVANKLVRWLNGALKGFTAGLLIAFGCFAMLPLAFLDYGIEASVAGILLGIAAAAFLDNKAHSDGNKGQLNGVAVLCLGIALHKLPEGIALGSLLETNKTTGFTMAIVMVAHCFPEAAFLFLALKEYGVGYAKQFALCFALCVPMALGAFLGVVFAGISPLFVSLCLTFAGGIMIYVACGEIIPETSRKLELGLSAAGAAAGFVLGTFITSHM